VVELRIRLFEVENGLVGVLLLVDEVGPEAVECGFLSVKFGLEFRECGGQVRLSLTTRLKFTPKPNTQARALSTLRFARVTAHNVLGGS